MGRESLLTQEATKMGTQKVEVQRRPLTLSLDRARQADACWCKVQDVGEQVVPQGLRETKWSKKRNCENIPTNNQEKLGENKGTHYELSRMGIIVVTGQRFPI